MNLLKNKWFEKGSSIFLGNSCHNFVQESKTQMTNIQT